MQWYYVQKGTLEDETVGPLDDAAMSQLVREGKLKPKTPVACTTVNQGAWYELQQFPALVALLAQGKKEREEQQESRRKQKQTEQALEAERRQRESDQQLAEASQRAQQAESHRQAAQYHSETRQVFDRYLMPEYLKVVWILSVVATALAIVGHWLSVAYAISNFEGSNALVAILGGIFFAIIMTIGHLIALIGVRFILELFAIIFDIRGLLKVQTTLAQQEARA